MLSSRLSRPSLFLASPFDVQYLRDMTVRVHEELQEGRDEAIGLFAWERETRQQAFDDRLPAQVQIPSPRDPLCRGVIAFFGEWIGRDLPKDFDKSPFATLGAEDEGLAYRLVHPWWEGAEKNGGFPLTGSTYEVLTALSAGMDGPRLKIVFVGVDGMDTGRLVSEEGWGGQRLRKEVMQCCFDENRMHELKAELKKIYLQISKLRNFFRYLCNVGGHVPRIVKDESDAEEVVRQFVEEILGPRRAIGPEVAFKGLGVFDEGDRAVYFGRETAVRAALQRIETLWADKDAPHLHWVRGQSGSGKSSFLRAGLVGSLRNRWGSSCVRLIVTPNRLVNVGVALKSQEPHWPLRRLLGLLLSQLRETNEWDPDVLKDLEAFDAAGDAAPDWAIELVRSNLDAMQEVARRFVLGFDQFEEAVDRLADPRTGDSWQEVVSFVLALSRMPGAMVIATMRDDRSEVLKRHGELAKIYAETGKASPPLQLPTGEDIAEIIRRPFSYVQDLELEKTLIPMLIERVHEFSAASNVRNAPISSYLPLISLTIVRLYEDVAAPLVREYRNLGRRDGAGKSGQTASGEFNEGADRDSPERAGAFLSVAAATNHEGRDYLDVGSAIATLAEEAVQATKEKWGPQWDDLEVGSVLRRFVGWSGSPVQPFSLLAARWPSEGVSRTLIEEMRARRLVVAEEGDRLRLVHEAVIWNWPTAEAWLKSERPLLEEAPVLLGMALKWERGAERDKSVDAAAVMCLDEALRMLCLWYEKLTEANPDDDPDRVLLLRAFCLEMLRRHGIAGAVIEGTPRQPTHLMLALFYGEMDIACRMVEGDPDAVHLSRSDGRTAVFFPAFDDRVDMLDLLLEKKANPDVADEKGWRPIHAAASRGVVAAAQRLVDAGVRLDGEGSPGLTAPLHLAAAGGHCAMIELLASKSPKQLEAMDDQGLTPLLRAVQAGKEAALATLIEFGARKNLTAFEGTPQDFGWSSLHLAAIAGIPQITKALLAEELDPTVQLGNGLTPLHLAARDGHAGTVRVLADALVGAGHGVDPRGVDDWDGSIKERIAQRSTFEPDPGNSKFDVTPLHLAVHNGHLDVIRILLKWAEVNAVTGAGATPLHVAARNDRAEAARLLLAAGAKADIVDAKGLTPLQAAIECDSWSAARAMIEAGVSIEVTLKDRPGLPRVSVSLLQDAVASRDLDAVRLFLRSVVDPRRVVRQPGPYGRTALHLAAMVGSVEAVDLCLGRGADALASDDYGFTPVHYAARNGSAQTLALLLRDIAPSDEQEGKTTPLHLAAYSGKPAVVEALLNAGWRSDWPDEAGLTPLHRAVQSGVRASVDALVAVGAKVAAETADGRANALTLAAQVGAEEVLDALLATDRFDLDLAPTCGEVPLLTALRYRRYRFAECLLRAGARAGVRDPESGLTIARIYVRQVREAIARRDPSPRHPGLEAALFKAGVVLSIPPLETQACPPVAGALAAPPQEPAPAKGKGRFAEPSPGRLEPGATGFVLEKPLSGSSDLWRDFGDDDLAALLGRISPVDGKWPLLPETTRAKRRWLPWYEHIELIRLRSAELDEQNVVLFFLHDQGKLYRLNGTSPPIHEANIKGEININEENVLEYLRFFTYFVRGEEGAFYLAETVLDPLLPRFDDPALRAVLAGTVQPATFERREENGNYLCRAVVYYSNALFSADFAVEPTGMIRMIDDEPIATDLPCRMSGRLS